MSRTSLVPGHPAELPREEDLSGMEDSLPGGELLPIECPRLTDGDAPLEDSDIDLLRTARTGDDGAFRKLVDRYAKDLFRVALSLTRNRADAEDVIQETFLGAYRGLKGFAGRSSVRTWLVQILTRQAAKAWNRNRRSRATLSLDRSEPNTTLDDQALETGASTHRTDLRMDLMTILQLLPPIHREVLVLREIQGMSYEQIAEVLGVPRGTVDSRLSRAREEFRRHLTMEQDEPI